MLKSELGNGAGKKSIELASLIALAVCACHQGSEAGSVPHGGNSRGSEVTDASAVINSRRAAGAMYVVDDEAAAPDLFRSIHDGSVVREQGWAGREGDTLKLVSSHFLFLPDLLGESIEQTRARLESSLDSVALPAGRWFAFQRVVVPAGVQVATSTHGWRTYVLSGTPAFTNNDVAELSTQSESSAIVVVLSLSAVRTGPFKSFTIVNDHRRAAMVSGRSVLAVAQLLAPITDGKFKIVMGPTDSNEVKETTAQLLQAFARGK